MRKRDGLIFATGAMAALATSASLFAAGGGSAGGADISKPDKAGDVNAKGLTARERRAIDIVRVHAYGDAFGTFVTVTFAGSFEATVGRGHLSRAVGGVVMRPRSGRPTVVATSGSDVGETGGGIGGRGPFVTVHQGRKVTFFARGFDFAKLRRLQVKTFAVIGGPHRSPQHASDHLNASVFQAIASRPGEDFWAQEVRGSGSSGATCETARASLARTRALFQEKIREINKARAESRSRTAEYLAEQAFSLEAAVRHYEQEVARLCGPPMSNCKGESRQNERNRNDEDVGVYECADDRPDLIQITLDRLFGGGFSASTVRRGAADPITRVNDYVIGGNNQLRSGKCSVANGVASCPLTAATIGVAAPLRPGEFFIVTIGPRPPVGTPIFIRVRTGGVTKQLTINSK